MMKVLILGGTGMLGHKLCQRLAERFDVATTVRKACERPGDLQGVRTVSGVDATSIETAREVIQTFRPDVVINAVGIVKQVAAAADVVETLEVNSLFPHRLAALSTELGFRLVTFSTDCVFSGAKGAYKETDIADAIDLYGISKRFGEPEGDAVLVIRTSIIGPELVTRHGLLEWFLASAGAVKGYSNAIFSGFPTVVLADLVGDLLEKQGDLAGTYHVSSAPISKLELLRLIRKAYRLATEITPDESIHIDRSLDSSLFRAATGFEPKAWPEMIELMAADHRR